MSEHEVVTPMGILQDVDIDFDFSRQVSSAQLPCFHARPRDLGAELVVSVDTAPLHTAQTMQMREAGEWRYMELPRDATRGSIMVSATPIDLGAEPEEGILFEGFPLGDLGLKRALVEYPDGLRVPFWGFFFASEDQTLAAAIAKTIGSGKLVNDAGEELILPDITGAEALQISLSRR
jgi:hypothetical protein